MTYIDALKCKRFLENIDKHFENVEIVNFDLIHHRCRGNSLVNFAKYYKTVKNGYSIKDQNKALSSTFRNKMDSFYIKRKLTIEYFKNLKF